MKIRSKVTQIAAGAALAGSALIVSAPAQATCVDQPYLGTICTTAGMYCPRGYSTAEGQLLSISQYTALYAYVGTTFGGDGRTTFGLPDLRGRSAVGTGTGPGLQMVRAGEYRGADTIKVPEQVMPEHTHTMEGATTESTQVASKLGATATAGTSPTPLADGVLAATGKANIYAAAGDDVKLAGPTITVPALNVTGSVASAGGSQSMIVHPPQLGLLNCIATEGLFPPRN